MLFISDAEIVNITSLQTEATEGSISGEAI